MDNPASPAIRDLDTCLKELATLGFANTASVKPGARVACGCCDHTVPAREIEILAVRRLEGPTDPAEARIILGLQCKGCHHKSALALTYGPAASSEDADVLQNLDETAWRAHST
jgi:hypothetical protein